jgi:hypothetical protein
VAIVTLSLALFLDAVNLELTELRRDWLAPPLVLGPATLLVAGLLARAGLSRYARQFIGWIGPRGLASLLFALLVVEDGVPGGEQLFAQSPDDIPRVTPAELSQRLAGPNPPVVLDVRSRSEYARDGVRIPGSIRVLPDQVTEWAADRLRDQPYVLYCT